MGAKELTRLSEAEAPKTVKCGTFAHSALEERHLATGDFDGRICLWDLERLDKGPMATVGGHEDYINAIDGVGGSGKIGAPEIATASRDGTVKVWDPRVKERPVACIKTKEGEKGRDAWAVAFGNSASATERMLAAGYDNGDLKMFDLRAMKLFWEARLPNGICSLQFDRSDIAMNKLLATCLEGRFHVWDLRTFNEKKGGFAMLEHQMDSSTATLWAGRYLPQNRDVFAICGGSGEISLWQYEYPDKRVKTVEKDGEKEEEGVAGTVKKLQEAQVGDQPVSALDWSPDKAGLGLCVSFDQTVKVIVTTRLNTL